MFDWAIIMAVLVFIGFVEIRFWLERNIFDSESMSNTIDSLIKILSGNFALIERNTEQIEKTLFLLEDIISIMKETEKDEEVEK